MSVEIFWDFDQPVDDVELNDDEVRDLMKISSQRVDAGDDVANEFITLINRGFSFEEKLAVLRNLWKLVLVDWHKHIFELYYLKKIGQRLGISTKESNALEAEVRQEMGIR